MRALKMLVLVAIGLTAALEVAGGSVAMATYPTLLCTKDKPVLQPVYADCLPPNEIHFLSVKVTLNGAEEIVEDAPITILTSPLNIECEMLIKGKLNGPTLANGPLQFLVGVKDLVFGNCNNNCTVQTIEGGTLLFLKTKWELAAVQLDDVVVRASCTFLIFKVLECDFSFNFTFGELRGALYKHTGEMGHISFDEEDILQPVGGFLCPEETALDALLGSKTEPIFVRS